MSFPLKVMDFSKIQKPITINNIYNKFLKK